MSDGLSYTRWDLVRDWTEAESHVPEICAEWDMVTQMFPQFQDLDVVCMRWSQYSRTLSIELSGGISLRRLPSGDWRTICDPPLNELPLVPAWAFEDPCPED